MTADLDGLIDLLARDGARSLTQFVPGSVRLSGMPATLFDEPQTVVDTVRGHAAYGEAVEALTSDPDVGRIAPKGALGPQLIAASAEPQVSADGLVGTMIGAAVAELRCLALEPSPDNLARISARNLERMRRIGRSAPTEVMTFLGFGDVRLGDHPDLALPWGRLTSRLGYYGVGEFVTVVRQTSSVLVAEYPLSIAIGDVKPSEGPAAPGQITGVLVSPRDVPRPIVDHYEWTQLTTRLVILSIALGTPHSRLAPLPTFQMTVLPYLIPTGATSPVLAVPPGSHTRLLNQEECAEIERWARILGDRYDRRLDIVARRLIAALSHRIDPADRLIDAVTAWESLFSAAQEASLRVTAAMAWFLEPDDPTRRDELQKEANTIYGLRSSVVHGSARDETEVYNGGWRATELAIRAVARLLEERPDLIAMKPSERSRRLLLGLP